MHHNHSERIPEEGVEAYTKIAEFKGMDFFREVANTVAESRPKLVLDVGTGPGILLAEIARLTEGVCIGIDCTKKFERYVKLYAERYGVASRVEFILGDGYMLPFKDNSFDVVTSTGVLHDLKCPEWLFEEIHRVLKLDGVAVIKDPTPLRITDKEAEKILNNEEMRVYENYRNSERKSGNIPETFDEGSVKCMLRNTGLEYKIRKEEGVLSLFAKVKSSPRKEELQK